MAFRQCLSEIQLNINYLPHRNNTDLEEFERYSKSIIARKKGLLDTEINSACFSRFFIPKQAAVNSVVVPETFQTQQSNKWSALDIVQRHYAILVLKQSIDQHVVTVSAIDGQRRCSIAPFDALMIPRIELLPLPVGGATNCSIESSWALSLERKRWESRDMMKQAWSGAFEEMRYAPPRLPQPKPINTELITSLALLLLGMGLGQLLYNSDFNFNRST